MTDTPEKPMLFVVANGAAIDLLSSLLDQPVDPHGDVPVWESMVPLRITRTDIQRYLFGNGDLVQISFWVEPNGADAIAGPDPETPRSLFDSLED